MEAEVLHEAAEEQGVCVLAFDRPGIGGTSFAKKESLEAVADDAAALLDALRVGQVLVVGCSGGGPYGAAMAARHPERVTGLVLLAAVAPTDSRHRALLREMHGMDRVQFGAVRFRLGIVWALHAILRYMAYHHPKILLQHAPEGMAAEDAALLAGDERIKEAFVRCLRHTYAQGARGVAKDVKVLNSTWRVDLGQIFCRTTIWHGEDDLSIPPAHARWYTTHIPGSELLLLPGEGHVTVPVRHADQILRSALQAAKLAPPQGAALNGAVAIAVPG